MLEDRPTYLLAHARISDPDTPAAQHLLAQARDAGERPQCTCRPGGVPMYVAKTPRGRYILKRMPETGPRHHPDCASHESPPHLSGRSDLDLHPDTHGLTILPLQMEWTRRSAKPRAAPRHRASRKHRPGEFHSPPSPGRASLRSLLHYLWEEAGFNRWTPAMEGKRNWGLIRHYLTHVAEATTLPDGTGLADHLWIPEPYTPARRDEINQAREQAWNRLTPTDGVYPIALMIAEWREFAQTKTGTPAMKVAQTATTFLLPAPVAQLRRSWPAIELHEQHGGHLLLAATFWISARGWPHVTDIAFAATDSHWLPYTSHDAHPVLEAAVARERRFRVPLSYERRSERALPVLVLTDVDPATAVYLTPPATPPPADQVSTWIVDSHLLPDPP